MSQDIMDPINSQAMYTIAGQPNPNAYTLSSDNLLIYASGSCIILYRCEHKIEYIGSFSAELIGNSNFDIIKSIATINNLIFLAYGEHVAILTINGDLKLKQSCGSTIHRICCSNDKLFIGCDDFIVLDHDLHQKFIMKMPLPIHILTCSEDGEFIITGGYQDTLLKVWHLKHVLLRGKRIDYSFIYLKHPKPVVHVEWKQEQHILLTNCMDLTTRIYQKDGTRLVLTCLIEPNKFADAMNDDFISLHWLNKSVLLKMVDTSSVKHLTPTKHQDEITFMNQNLPNPALIQDETLHYWQQKVQLMINEHPVLLFGVDKSGCLYLWSLQNIQTTPRSIAKVVQLLKIKDAFDDPIPNDPDFNYFFSQVFSFHSMPPVVLDEEMSPYKLYMLGQNLQNGHLHIYHLDFVESFLKQASTSTKVTLIAKYQGHIVQPKTTFNGFNRHPDQLYPYLISYRDQDVIIWKVVNHLINKTFNEPLQEISKLSLPNTNPLNIRWIPSDPAFIVMSHFKLFIYLISDVDKKQTLTLLYKCYIPNDYYNYQLFINPPLSHLSAQVDLLLYLVHSNEIQQCQLCSVKDENEPKLEFKVISTTQHTITHISRLFTMPSILHLKYKTNMHQNDPQNALFVGLQGSDLILFSIDNVDDTIINIISTFHLAETRLNRILTSPSHCAVIYPQSLLVININDSHYYPFDIPNIINLDTITTTNQCDIFAVCVPSQIVIISNYQIIQTIPTSVSPMDCSISWLHMGNICLMMNQQLVVLHVITPNKPQIGTPTSTSPGATGNSNYSPNLLEYITTTTIYLPDYHPYIIQQYLILNNTAIINIILNRLIVYLEHPATGYIPLTFNDMNSNEVDYSREYGIGECCSHLLGLQDLSLLEFGSAQVTQLKLLLQYIPTHMSNQFMDYYQLQLELYKAVQGTSKGILGTLGKLSENIQTGAGTLVDFINTKAVLYTTKQQQEMMIKKDYGACKDIYNTTLLYLALNSNKVNIVLLLWKQHSQQPDAAKIIGFLKNHVITPNPTACLKNAYVLLSKNQYLLASIFYLLGLDLQGCCHVLVTYLDLGDIALMIAMNYENKDLYNALLDQLMDISDDLFEKALYCAAKGTKEDALPILSQIKGSNAIYAYILTKNTIALKNAVFHYSKCASPILSLLLNKHFNNSFSIAIPITSGLLLTNIINTWRSYIQLLIHVPEMASFYLSNINQSKVLIMDELQIDSALLDDLMSWYCIHNNEFTLYFKLIKTPDLGYYKQQIGIYCNTLLTYTADMTEDGALPHYLLNKGIQLLETLHHCPLLNVLSTGIILIINASMGLMDYYKVAIVLMNMNTLYRLVIEGMDMGDMLGMVLGGLAEIRDKDACEFIATTTGNEAKQLLDLLILRYIINILITTDTSLIQPLLYKCLLLETSIKIQGDDMGLYKQRLQYVEMQDVWDIVCAWGTEEGFVGNLINKRHFNQLPKVGAVGTGVGAIVHDNEPYSATEELVKLGTMIYASGINVVNNNEMVVCTSKGIWEMDVNYAWCCYKDVDTDNCSSTSNRDKEDTKSETIFTSMPRNQLEESLTQMSSQAELEEYHPPAPGNSPMQTSPSGTLPRNYSGGFMNQFHRNINKSGKSTDVSSMVSEGFISEVVKLQRPIIAKELAINPKYKIYACECPNTSTWSIGNDTNSTHVGVYQFNTSKVIIEFPLKYTNVRLNFDDFGEKFGAFSTDGHLQLYDLVHGTTPVMENALMYKVGHDFCFLNSGTLLATSGKYNGTGKIGIYDSLLPQNKAEVETYQVSEHCTFKVQFHNNQLISIGRRGEITVIDIRQHKILDTFHAHNSSINTMLITPGLNSFFTGSVEGSLKQFSLNTHDCMRNYKKLHNSKFMGNSDTSGLSSICESNLNIYTTGYDGYVKYIRKNALKMTDTMLEEGER